MPSTAGRRRTARARRPLPPPSDRATSARRRSASAPAAATQTVLPDDIWEEILLRVDAASDLARASAACSTFRRIVADRRFLRSPAVLGFLTRAGYGRHGFLPVGPPHRSAAEARALEEAADFTLLSFLPDACTWDLRHACGGRVLLSRRISAKIWFDDFLVCDPLHRQCVRIPRIPDDLMASAPRTVHLESVLVPDEADESFRVIFTMQRRDKVMAFVFSSCNQTWRGIIRTIHLPNGYKFTQPRAYYAHGCLYWMFYDMGYSLVLDTSEMEFSVIDLPPLNFDKERAIVEAEEGRLSFLTVADGTIDLYCKNWQRNGVGAQEWQHDKLITLPKDSEINYTWTILGIVGHCLALLGSREICDELQKSEYFLLDTKTLLLEKVCTSSSDVVLFGIPYARFPPPFALPSI